MGTHVPRAFGPKVATVYGLSGGARAVLLTQATVSRTFVTWQFISFFGQCVKTIPPVTSSESTLARPNVPSDAQ